MPKGILQGEKINGVRVFKHEDGKIYEVDYTQGLTELQDEHPFEYEKDEIEVHEVEPVEVVSVKYIRKDRDIREPV